MEFVRIEKPKLNRPTPEENMALVDKWISDTSDKLNYVIQQIMRERKENDGE
jgi:hypothetical protein